MTSKKYQTNSTPPSSIASQVRSLAELHLNYALSIDRLPENPARVVFIIPSYNGFASMSEALEGEGNVEVYRMASPDGQEEAYSTVFRSRKTWSPSTKSRIIEAAKERSPKPSYDERMRRTPGEEPDGYRLPYRDRWGIVRYTELFGEEFREFIAGHPTGVEMISGLEAGWLSSMVASVETVVIGRWQHSYESRQRNQYSDRPIPYLKWARKPLSKTMEHLEYCLSVIDPDWRQDPHPVIEHFFRWLLWSLGDPSVPDFPLYPKNPRYHDYVFQVFSLEWLYAEPFDYFGELLQKHTNLPAQISMKRAVEVAENLFPRAYSDRSAKMKQSPGVKKAEGFSPSAKRNPVDYREELIVDLECGTGRMMLACSNFNHRHIGVSSDPNPLTNMAYKLNCYFFSPYSIFPLPKSTEQTEEDIRNAESRAFTIARTKGIDPVEFVQTTMPVANASEFLPVIQRQRFSIQKQDFAMPKNSGQLQEKDSYCTDSLSLPD